jgi:hypothetical protein
MSLINADFHHSREFSRTASSRYLGVNGFLNPTSRIAEGDFRSWQRSRSARNGAIADRFSYHNTRDKRITAEVSPSKQFIPADIPFNANALFDLGIVDANNDGFLDVFTSNHNAIQSLLLGHSSGTFTDTLSQWNLGHTRNFPGIAADLNSKPSPRDPGLFIYRKNQKTLSIHLQRPGAHTEPLPHQQIRGQLVFAAPDLEKASIAVHDQHRAKFRVHERPLQKGYRITVDFEIHSNGYLDLDTRFIALPYKFKLDKPFHLHDVYLGSQKLNPKNHTFKLTWRDRHGTAWADYQGDGLMDVFMSRGGLKGRISNFPLGVKLQDQFFVNQGNGQFRDRASGLGFTKGNCRTRKVEWVDFNQDNRLDLYMSGKESSHNRLFQQQANGRFKNVAPRLGVDFDNTQLFEWLDADNDGDQDLLVARNQRLELYDNRSGQFRLNWTAQIPGDAPQKLAIADYDRDGDLDGYLASPRSSILLKNRGGRFAIADPKIIGLPTRGLTANWVDYDNDGRLDLHVLPGQLYRQTAKHQFVRTALFGKQSYSRTTSEKAKASWFDFDNNGTRDVLFAVHDPQPKPSFYRNAIAHNNWLQVQLVGPKKNRQAIGARVILETLDGRQLQEVGASEGSHYSQGHYRLYFGLGKHETIESMKVIWGDGTRQRIQPPLVNQRLTVQYSKA